MAELRLADVYGPGTFADQDFVSVPTDAHRILRLLAAQTPGFTKNNDVITKVRFKGDADPVISGPIESTPVAAALHAMVGILANEISTLRRPSDSNRRIVINTTHTALWLGSVAAVYLDHEPVVSLLRNKQRFDALVPDWQQQGLDPRLSPQVKLRATAIYPTKTPGQWYSLHGSLNPEPMLRNLGIDPFPESPMTTLSEAAAYIRNATTKLTSSEIEYANISSGHCGTICHTPASWASTTMGQALTKHPLIDVIPQPGHSTPLPPISFPPLDPTNALPLQGIKVLELARIIAAPVASSILASLGATVIKVNAPHLPDMSVLQLTLTVGKTTTCLDLRDPADLGQFHSLLKEADVFIQGFRPGALDKFGLSQDDVLSMAVKRNRGIVYVSENCFGPDGLYATRPGWQQMADCASGVAYVMGRGYNLPNEEPVLPSLPVSDMTCGLVCAVGAMMALRNRAKEGGSWIVRGSLVRVDTFLLEREVGLYSREVVEKCQERFMWGEMRGEQHVLELLRVTWEGWDRDRKMRDHLREDGEWWESWEESAVGGRKLSILRPVVRFEGDGVVQKEQPRWVTGSVPYGFWDKKNVAF
ncbi:CoA-transferase family III domain-containing protein [Triangularia verruculosa]|uniref:CoA-transferase family III domain-containing protein n=1 Tax=Triangularia verruculosa TaxID=2587418 RepID=A0AAN6XTH7_9PEZI|nr:CoA-transferase family III domain-containing protein [Triangularia verruculosa]